MPHFSHLRSGGHVGHHSGDLPSRADAEFFLALAGGPRISAAIIARVVVVLVCRDTNEGCHFSRLRSGHQEGHHSGICLLGLASAVELTLYLETGQYSAQLQLVWRELPA